MKKGCYTLALVLLAACQPRAERLRTGDLLFCGAPAATEDTTAAGAISASVGRGAVHWTHVALLEVLADGIWVIDATPGRGVDRHPLDTLLHDFTPADGTAPVLAVKRLRHGAPKDCIRRAEQFLGQPYDHSFRPDNGRMYCSELIRECFRDRRGRYLFENRPMNFHDAAGRFPTYWVRLFESLGEPIPQDVPGTNPQDMAESPLLRDVSSFRRTPQPAGK